MSKLQSNNTYCIYRHTSPSGKHYIGQTSNYERRCLKHKSPNSCTSFYRSIKKYGWDNFTHEILEDNLTIEEANDREVFYIEKFNSLSPNGYNLKVGGENKRFSEETLEKMRKSNIGKKASEEARKKMSESQTGRKASEETKEKLRNRVVSEETREKLRNRQYSEEQKIQIALKISLHHKGKVVSQETKEKQSLAAKNRSPETREKITEALRGRKWTIEQREKMLKHPPPHLGKKHSDETKKKLSVSKTGKSIKEWHIITPDGDHLIIKSMVEFCNENKFFNYTALGNAIRANKLYKGHKVYNIDKRHK